MSRAAFCHFNLLHSVFQHRPTIGTQNTVIRKYTPISADINIPCLIFQLSGDLSEGEQVSSHLQFYFVLKRKTYVCFVVYISFGFSIVFVSAVYQQNYLLTSSTV